MTYTIATIEDIADIPDEHIREFACDNFKAYRQIADLVKPFGLEIGAIRFTPNGLGKVSYNVSIATKE
jgi:hypothetical protein